MPVPDAATMEEIRRSYGNLAAFMEIPEVGAILMQAAREGWDEQRLQGALQSTSWWRTTSEATRAWDAREKLDPATNARMVEQQIAAVREQARKDGVELNDDQARRIATNALRFKWSARELSVAVSAEFVFTGSTGQIAALVAKLGSAAAFTEHPEIGPIVQQAAREGWSQEQFVSAVQATEWYRTTSESNREWEALTDTDPASANQRIEQRIAELSSAAMQAGVEMAPERLRQLATESLRNNWNSAQVQQVIRDEVRTSGLSSTAREFSQLQRDDPVTAEQQVTNTIARIREAAERKGVTLTETRVREIATQSLTNGWDQSQVDNAMLEGFVFDPDNAQGEAAGVATQVKRLASDYLVPMADATAGRWVAQIMDGSQTIEGVRAYMVEQAKSMFPSLSAALDTGVTVRQYADPYVQTAAQLLEINPDSVDLLDPKWGRALLQVDGQSGNRTSLSLYDWRSTLMSDPQYGYDGTTGARTQGARLSDAFMSTFGATG